jgi:hypothetical protein
MVWGDLGRRIPLFASVQPYQEPGIRSECFVAEFTNAY